MSKRVKFNPLWFKEPSFSNWLQEDPIDKYAFKCKLCFVKLDLGRMGKSALTKHKKAIKHINLETAQRSDSANLMTLWTNPVARCVTPSPSVSSESLRNEAEDTNAASTSVPSNVVPGDESGPSSSLLTAENWAITDQILKAEILWALQSTMNYNSHTSNRYTSRLFEAMFPDSVIAKKFTCGSDKTTYLVNYGLAPYFADKLIHSLNEATLYSISYDESFNRESKNEQMDFGVRFWDSRKSRVVDRYLTSEFLGHPNAENLLESFIKATCKLDSKKLIQVSLDGPNVNHKFLRLLKAQRASTGNYVGTVNFW